MTTVSTTILTSATRVTVTVQSKSDERLWASRPPDGSRWLLFDGSDCVVRAAPDGRWSIAVIGAPKVVADSQVSFHAPHDDPKRDFVSLFVYDMWIMEAVAAIPSTVANQLKLEHPPDASRLIAQRMLAGKYSLTGSTHTGDRLVATLELTESGRKMLMDALQAGHAATGPSTRE